MGDVRSQNLLWTHTKQTQRVQTPTNFEEALKKKCGPSALWGAEISVYICMYM